MGLWPGPALPFLCHVGFLPLGGVLALWSWALPGITSEAAGGLGGQRCLGAQYQEGLSVGAVSNGPLDTWVIIPDPKPSSRHSTDRSLGRLSQMPSGAGAALPYGEPWGRRGVREGDPGGSPVSGQGELSGLQDTPILFFLRTGHCSPTNPCTPSPLWGRADQKGDPAG